MKSLLSLGLVACFVLAGCSDAPPSGEFDLGSGNLAASGTATVDYQEFQDPLGVAGGPLDPAGCAQDQIPATPPDQRCVQPYSMFAINVSLPAGDPAAPYTAWFVNATSELQIGQLAPMGDVHATTNTFPVDLSEAGSLIEVRMGDVAVATAPATEGANPIEPAQPLRQVSGTATYRGRDLTVTVQGIPENATAVGRLYEEGVMEPVETFPVSNGETTHRASRNIAAYSEFHIHLGGSRIALTEATIE